MSSESIQQSGYIEPQRPGQEPNPSYGWVPNPEAEASIGTPDSTQQTGQEQGTSFNTDVVSAEVAEVTSEDVETAGQASVPEQSTEVTVDDGDTAPVEPSAYQTAINRNKQSGALPRSTGRQTELAFKRALQKAGKIVEEVGTDAASRHGLGVKGQQAYKRFNPQTGGHEDAVTPPTEMEISVDGRSTTNLLGVSVNQSTQGIGKSTEETSTMVIGNQSHATSKGGTGITGREKAGRVAETEADQRHVAAQQLWNMRKDLNAVRAAARAEKPADAKP
jgi:hypothetical protein